MALSRMTTEQADEMAIQFARANGVDLGLVPGLRAWASLEAHLNPPNADAVHHPEASELRILSAKWSGFLRHNGFAR